MKKLSFITAFAALALAVLVAGALAAKKPVSFSAKYTGTAVTQQTDNTVALTVNGTGSGTLGAGKVTGTGTADASVRPCVPFTGTGSLTGPKGVVQFKVLPGSTGCGDDAGQVFTFTAKAQVLKTTGTYKGVKGQLRVTGTFDRSSGAFSSKFLGLLK
jgi:hypothetical protein